MDYFLNYADLNLNPATRGRKTYFMPKDYRALCRKFKEELRRNDVQIAYHGAISHLSIKGKQGLSKFHCHMTLIAFNQWELARAKEILQKLVAGYTTHQRAFLWQDDEASNILKFVLYNLPQVYKKAIIFNNTKCYIKSKRDFENIVVRGTMLNQKREIDKRTMHKMNSKIQATSENLGEHKLEMQLLHKAGIFLSTCTQSIEGVTLAQIDYNMLVSGYLAELEGVFE